MFKNRDEVHLLESLDDLSSELQSGDEKNYAQLISDYFKCEACYIIIKNFPGDSTVFQRNENLKLDDNTISEEELKKLYEVELLKQYSGSPETTIKNIDPIYLRITNSKKQYMSLSIILRYEGIDIGILSCIFKKKSSESLLKYALPIASQLISSSLYKIYLNKRVDDLEILNMKERDIARTTIDTTGTATILIEEDTTISYANSDFEVLSGYKKEEIEDQKSFTEFVIKDDIERMMEYHRLRRINSSKAPRNYEFTFIDRSKNLKYIYMTIDIIPGTSLSIGSFLNITERKRLESEIVNVSEMERQQLGRDLHDGLGPHLLGIKFMVNTLKQHVEKKKIPELEDVNDIYDALSEAIDHTRRIMKGLRPVVQAEDFIYTIKDMLVNVEKLFNVQCVLKNNEFVLKENIVATHLYYITQEAINNAVKHGEAKKLDVSFLFENNVLTLEILDNGIGIPKLPDVERGMGINIMKYRAKILHTNLEINRRSEGGTRVALVMENHSSVKGE